MSVTINAHQLGQLIDKTIGHMGSEYVEPLHGIRLDVDAKYLYAVATDRHTIAAARYQLNHGDLDQEPWARTIPGEHLRALREWLQVMEGAGSVTISATEDRLSFEGPQSDLSIAVNTAIVFPDWRSLFRRLTDAPAEPHPFPALNSGYLGRFHLGGPLRVRVTADDKALLVFAEDFIGAQMPTRYAGIYPCAEESFEGALDAWAWTLRADSDGADLKDPAFDEDMPRYEATRDIRETGESLLREVLRSTTDVHHTDHDAENDLWMAHIRIGVANWMAFRYLNALHNVDPRAAQAAVNETAIELDAGEIGEWAWDEAKTAGFDPQKWHDEYEAHLKKLAEANKPSEPSVENATV